MIKIFEKFFDSVWFRFQKPETGKTPTEQNRFSWGGTINTKNKVLILNPSVHWTPTVLLLDPKSLPHNSHFTLSPSRTDL